MANTRLSLKHIQIDKANRTVILTVAVSAVIVVFGIFVGRAMLMRQKHQSRVIAAKELAVKQLKENIEAKNQIVDAYRQFTTTSVNILSGSTSPTAQGAKDGDNARIILDALPSKYDFPALATSIENLLVSNGFTITSLSGTDDEVNQAIVEAQPNPEVTEIPFNLSVSDTDYLGMQKLVGLLEASIRPLKVQSMTLSGSSKAMKIEMQLSTYYLPEKSLSITDKEIQ